MPTVIYIIKNSDVAVPTRFEGHSRDLLEFSLKFPTPDLKSCFVRSLTFLAETNNTNFYWYSVNYNEAHW